MKQLKINMVLCLCWAMALYAKSNDQEQSPTDLIEQIKNITVQAKNGGLTVQDLHTALRVETTNYTGAADMTKESKERTLRIILGVVAAALGLFFVGNAMFTQPVTKVNSIPEAKGLLNSISGEELERALSRGGGAVESVYIPSDGFSEAVVRAAVTAELEAYDKALDAGNDKEAAGRVGVDAYNDVLLKAKQRGVYS